MQSFQIFKNEVTFLKTRYIYWSQNRKFTKWIVFLIGNNVKYWIYTSDGNNKLYNIHSPEIQDIIEKMWAIQKEQVSPDCQGEERLRFRMWEQPNCVRHVHGKSFWCFPV